MENPTKWRDCRLRSPALDRPELIVEKGANRLRAFHYLRIRSSGTRRFPPSGLCRERRPNLRRLAPSPNINSVLSIARELRRPSTRVVAVQMEIRL
jgi:hypothetical protein